MPLTSTPAGGEGSSAQQRKRAQYVLVTLLPLEPAERHDRVLARRRVKWRQREARGVDTRRTHDHALTLDALQLQGARRALGRGQEQVGVREHAIAVAPGATVAIGREQRQRLPDRLHQLEAMAVLAPGRVRREPVGELLGVHHVGLRERPLGRAQVAVAEHVRGDVAEQSTRHEVTQRVHPHRPQALRRREAV